MSKPIRWFSVPQLFRYERPQRGRLREHFQWNVDIVGEASVSADAEILAVAIDGVRDLGLTSADFFARVSDRRLLTAVLEALGTPQDGLAVAFAVIDKLERMSRAAAVEGLGQVIGLGEDDAEGAFEMFAAPGLAAVRDRFGDDERVMAAAEPLVEYVDLLKAMGLGDFVEVDLRIVRGLAYYTGIVFELFGRRAQARAICGGGRYDRLLELVGGEPLPAVGFGMGDVVLADLVTERGLAPPSPRTVQYYLVSVDDDHRGLLLSLAHRLREAGSSVLYSLRGQSVRKQLAAARQEGAERAVILGPDEVARGTAVVRDMESGEEVETPLVDFGVDGFGD